MTWRDASSDSARKPERREVGERLVHVPARVLQIDAIVERQLELVVVGSEELATRARVGELVRLAVPGEADGERLDRLGHVPRHQSDDQARVETAREHRAERDVAHEPQRGRIRRASRAARSACVVERRPAGSSGSGYASRLRPRTVPSSTTSVWPGQELADAAQRRERRREEAERQVRVDRGVVELDVDEPDSRAGS